MKITLNYRFKFEPAQLDPSDTVTLNSSMSEYCCTELQPSSVWVFGGHFRSRPQEKRNLKNRNEFEKEWSWIIHRTCFNVFRKYSFFPNDRLTDYTGIDSRDWTTNKSIINLRQMWEVHLKGSFFSTNNGRRIEIPWVKII
jgi:hypothetical protein